MTTKMKTESATDSAWELIDMMAKKKGPKTPVELVFDGDDVSGSWYHPAMAKTVCALCGKDCREKGLSPCVNVNPLCG